MKSKSYVRAIRGPLLRCLTRRAAPLLSESPASCSHIGKSQAPAAAAAAAAEAAAAAAALLTASVSGHLPPGNGAVVDENRQPARPVPGATQSLSRLCHRNTNV